MPTPRIRNVFPISFIVLTAHWSVAQTQATCKALPIPSSTCSLTGLNRNCDIYIDRMRPITPPMIYARRGVSITVHVINPSPFETIALDLKSASDSSAPDLYSGAFAGQSANMNKMEFDAFSSPLSLTMTPDQQQFADMRAKLKHDAEEQRTLLSEIEVATVFHKIAAVLQVPPADACANLLAWDADGYPNPWLAPSEWGKAVDSALLNLETPANLDRSTLKTQVDKLALDVASVISYSPPSTIEESARQRWSSASQAVTNRQGLITAALGRATIAAPAMANLEALRGALSALGLDSYVREDQVKTVNDLSPNNSNYTSTSWSLDFANSLTTSTKNALGTAPNFSVSPTSATDVVTAQPPATSFATISVSFQRQPRLEFATGLMVPLRPYHSYSTAATATSGAVTGNVVQQTLTYTVVPLALVNLVVAQGLAKRNPVAAFFTIGTGYNPATTSVEFGIGPSFSWRSIMISGLADIGRDTGLAGGFTVNEALPTSNPPKPLTNTYWSVKPAIALSVRIPLGSGGSSGNGGGSGAGGGSGNGGGTGSGASTKGGGSGSK